MAKKLIVILLCSFILGCASYEIKDSENIEGGFRNHIWGTKYKTIEKNENNIGNLRNEKLEKGELSWNFEVYSHEEELGGFGKGNVEYIFLKNRLIKGRYTFKKIGTGREMYYSFKELLIAKYGKPNGYNDVSSYVKEGKYHMRETVWYVKENKIELQLLGTETIKIIYSPTDKTMLNFIMKTGEEEKNQNIKQLLEEHKDFLDKI